MSFDRAAIAEEVRHWFFDVYFQHWVAVGAGRSADGPAFILRYWGTPMFVTHNEPPVASWVMTGDDIVASLVNQQKALKDAGFDHTEIPEARVFVYNPNGASVEVIFSRQTADDRSFSAWSSTSKQPAWTAFGKWWAFIPAPHGRRPTAAASTPPGRPRGHRQIRGPIWCPGRISVWFQQGRTPSLEGKR